MILLGKLDINGKHFTINDSDGTVYLKELGLPDNWYGGYVKELRKTKYGIYMCITRKGEIVNLGYTKDSMTDEGWKLLGVELLPFSPQNTYDAEERDAAKMLDHGFSENTDTDISQLERKELIALAKELKIEGKLATMKTVDLIAAIQEKRES